LRVPVNWLSPETVIFPTRWVVKMKGVTTYVTLPVPLPLLLEIIVIQLALLVAVQLQTLDVVTPTLPIPPSEVKEALDGSIE